MDFRLTNNVSLQGLKADTALSLKQRLTMPNPAYAEAKKMGHWTGKLKKTLLFYKDAQDGALICPMGAATQVFKLCQRHNELIKVQDNRLELKPVKMTFKGTLRPYQEKAVKGVLMKDHGLLSAPTGSGKTCIGLFIIAQRKQPTLIIVHTRELLAQWTAAIEKFLSIPADQVGVIGGGKFSIGKKITIALVQSLYTRLDKVIPYIGQVVVDECHKAPAKTFTDAISAFPAKYRLGLSATPWRRDKLSKAIFWYIGDVTGQIDKQDLLDNGSLCPAEVLFSFTGAKSSSDPVASYSKALSELTQDVCRNKLLSSMAKKHSGSGITAILSDRRKHCQLLAEELEKDGIQAAVLTGETKAKEREQIVQDLRTGKTHCLIATGQLIGEGFDLPEISTLALATPVKFSGRVIQYIGRALRPAPGKDKAIILDFVDAHPVFRASARSRQRVYRSQNINIIGE